MAEVVLEPMETKVYRVKIKLTDPAIIKWVDTRLIKEQFELSGLLEKYPNSLLVEAEYEKSSGIFYFLLLGPHNIKYEDVKSAVDDDMVKIKKRME
jgi:hypothetical protein